MVLLAMNIVSMIHQYILQKVSLNRSTHKFFYLSLDENVAKGSKKLDPPVCPLGAMVQCSLIPCL